MSLKRLTNFQTALNSPDENSLSNLYDKNLEDIVNILEFGLMAKPVNRIDPDTGLDLTYYTASKAIPMLLTDVYNKVHNSDYSESYNTSRLLSNLTIMVAELYMEQIGKATDELIQYCINNGHDFMENNWSDEFGCDTYYSVHVISETKIMLFVQTQSKDFVILRDVRFELVDYHVRRAYRELELTDEFISGVVEDSYDFKNFKEAYDLDPKKAYFEAFRRGCSKWSENSDYIEGHTYGLYRPRHLDIINNFRNDKNSSNKSTCSFRYKDDRDIGYIYSTKNFNIGSSSNVVDTHPLRYLSDIMGSWGEYNED